MRLPCDPHIPVWGHQSDGRREAEELSAPPFHSSIPRGLTEGPSSCPPREGALTLCPALQILGNPGRQTAAPPTAGCEKCSLALSPCGDSSALPPAFLTLRLCPCCSGRCQRKPYAHICGCPLLLSGPWMLPPNCPLGDTGTPTFSLCVLLPPSAGSPPTPRSPHPQGNDHRQAPC